ncbi:cell division protein FtsQ/DivIB [Candidatus Cyanaurora vandensis]|uniref:cell division protein FtsQ/DivIB n=1 Tax=Candidatus Cyanaurora vandensis TaxID=2714958 RepID=UPI002579D1C7|nr:FtsQ-type POTRA domain-containing protein [Candidatus Cyanaurora vandensis]
MTLTQAQFSKQDYVARRKLVRRQQWYQRLKNWWRYGLLLTLVGLSFWVGQSPWELVRPEQVVVVGQRVLTSQRVRDLLALEFPLRIFEVEPGELQTLVHREPLVLAVGVRRHWPPRLELTILERTPVAVAFEQGQPGVLDKDGVWLSLRHYPTLAQPSLRVVGYTAQLQARWQQLYPILATAAVPVRRVNFSDPANLILETGLGVVHLGHPDQLQLKEQLLTLDRLRHLPRVVARERVAFIDLRSPLAPQIRQRPLPTPPKPTIFN